MARISRQHRRRQAFVSMAPVTSQDEAEIPMLNGVPQIAESQPPQPVAAASTSLNIAIGELPVGFSDPNMLDCPICREPLCAPIYQCLNGHIACSPCCTKSNEKCPSCTLPIGSNRCRAIENVIASIKVHCKNMAYGCTDSPIYCNKSEHEEACMYALCFCPIPSCGFSGSFNHVYDHFVSQHTLSAISFSFGDVFQLSVRRNQKHMILRERNEGVIFILNHEVLQHGRVFDVDCVGPKFFRNGFVYKLSVRCSQSCFWVESVPEMCAKWEEHTPSNNRLRVPSRFTEFAVDVCIKRI